MARKGENIYKRKDGRWEGRFIKNYDNEGKIKYGYVYAKSYKDVKSQLIDARINLSKRKYGNKEINGDTTYEELTEKWLSYIKLNVKESTYVRYRTIIDNHLLPTLGNYKLCRLNTKIIEDLIEVLLIDGRKDKSGGLSSKTVSDIITIIKSIFSYADYNNYEVDCNLKMLSIKKDCHEIRIISHNEQKILKDLLTKEIDLCKAGVLLSMYTGIRIGELCALKWENIDLENKILNIQYTMQRIKYIKGLKAPDSDQLIHGDRLLTKTKLVLTQPKTKASIRKIPLPEYMANILSDFKSTDDAFFLTGKSDEYIEPRTMQNYFKRYIKECNIEDINFHALRHTFATRCIELGFEVKSLSEILGHSSVNITLNRYVHSSFALKKENMDKLYF